MDPRYQAGANVLLDDPEAGLLEQMHGRMAPSMGGQVQPQMVDPRAQAQAPMGRPMPQPQAGPPMMRPQAQGVAALGSAPVAQVQPRPAPQAPARPPMSFEDQAQAYRKAMRQEYPDMPEQDFERYVQYGIAKQRGKVAAKQTKTMAKPLSHYMSALASQHAAELAHKQLHTRLASKKFEYTNKADGSMMDEWMPYQDQINASRLKVDERGAQAEHYRGVLKKLGVTDEDLANPVTFYSYQQALAGSDPQHADTFPEDTDLLPDAQ